MSEGKEDLREIENRVISSFARVTRREIDRAELRLLLDRFEGVDCVVEAHRCARWIEDKGGPVTAPLKLYETWLGKARPMTRRPVKGERVGLTEPVIAGLVARKRAVLGRCMDWEGSRPTGDLREVPFYSPAELEAELAEFEGELRERSLNV